MSMIKFAARLGLLVSTGLVGMAAHADSDTSHSQLDFAQLKAKCSELSSNQQLKPFKAIVSCRDVQYVWREVPQKGQQGLNNSREVGASIRMKVFETPYQGQNVDMSPTQNSCLMLEKFKLSVPTVDSELDCDELNRIDDMTRYCLDQVSQRKLDDPSLTQEESTGQTFNSCDNPAIQRLNEQKD